MQKEMEISPTRISIGIVFQDRQEILKAVRLQGSSQSLPDMLRRWTAADNHANLKVVQ
jgi:hypothetical protein